MTVRITPRAQGHRLESRIVLPRPRAELFEFFSDPSNLELLTPDRLRFEILSPRPIPMRVGALIDYRLRLHGVPLRWQSEITAFDPPIRFVDEQRRGPYWFWRHEHRFRAREGGTVVEDIVDYAVPGGRLVHAIFVQRDLHRIFTYRAEYLRHRFAADPEAQAKAVMEKIEVA